MKVETEALVKRYGGFMLSLPALRVDPGETFGLVGNNGAGKTTFLRLILDLVRADKGQVLVDGHDTAASEEWKKRTGSYLDEGFLIDFLTPDEFLEFTLSVYALRDESSRLGRYSAFFTEERFGKTTKYIRELSQGNRKKIGLIAAMMIDPELLILDEPFAALDPRSQIQLKGMLTRMNEVLGTTMIISSHDLDHVTDVCRRIAILEEGRIVRDAATGPDTVRELEEYFSRQIPETEMADLSATRRP